MFSKKTLMFKKSLKVFLKKVVVFSKNFSTFLKKLGISKEDTVIVGDRIYTDIACGVNAGVDTICVLSGEATLADLEKSDTKPTWIFDSVREVCTELAR